MEDIQILEDMRDEINGYLWEEDDYQMSAKAQKQFDALNWAIKELKNRDNYISKQVIRDKVNEINKSMDVYCKTRASGKSMAQLLQFMKNVSLIEYLNELLDKNNN